MGFQCLVCEKLFSKQSNLNRHKRQVHRFKTVPGSVSYDKSVWNYKCLDENCNNSYQKQGGLVHHLQQKHNLQFEAEELVFNNYNEFESWKTNYERENKCSYYVSHTSKSSAGNIMFYKCHRTKSSKKVKQNRLRKLKSQGSCKLNFACTSYLKLIYNEDKLSVHFQKTHYGHTLDLQHIRKSKYGSIASKLRAGVTKPRMEFSMNEEVNENLKENHSSNALYCRLCLDKIEEKDAIQVTSDGPLYQKILECVSVMISAENNFSQCICFCCMEQLNKWEHFKGKCQKSQETLLMRGGIIGISNDQILSPPKIKPENNEFLEEIKIVVEEEEEITLEEKRNTTRNSLSCADCCLDFESKEALKIHNAGHKIQCQECGIIMLKTSWRSHKNLHTDRFKCPHCSKPFQAECQLQEHIVGVHEKSQNFVCHICAKMFSTKTSVQMHLLTHSERRHQCSLCPFAARTASNLKNHMATHADGTAIFKCGKCESTFISSRGLRDHIYRIHRLERIHECSFCGRKFTSKYVLENHLKTHTGQKPFKCSRCSKSFARKCHLKDHEKCHDRRPAHPCGDCAEELMSKRALENHVCRPNENDPMGTDSSIHL